MDFSQFKSWIKNVSEDRMRYAEAYDMKGSWWFVPYDGEDKHVDERLYLRHPKHKGMRYSDECYGIVFVSAAYRDPDEKPEHYELNYGAVIVGNQFNTDDELIFYIPEGGYGHLGFFLDKEDAQAAMQYAAAEITKEVNHAIENGIPSIYFKTSWLTGQAEQSFVQSLEKDTGGTYEFEFVDKDDLLDRDTGKPTCTVPDEFIRVVRDTKNMENYALRCIQMEEAFIKDICAKIDVEACCDRTGELLLNFSEEKFEEQLRKAYAAVVDFYANGIWCCFDIMRALGEEADPGEPLNKQTQEALMEWRSMDFVRPHVLTYVYSRLTEIMSAVNGSDCE